MPRVAEKRQSEANWIREKYPDRIPVSFYPPVCTASFFLIALIQFMTIFYNAGDCREIPELKNHKRRLGLDHSSAISFFLPAPPQPPTELNPRRILVRHLRVALLIQVANPTELNPFDMPFDFIIAYF